MPFDDDADADLPPYHPPPHPDDRIWRHPSEMRAHPITRICAPDGTTAHAGPTRGGRPWGAYVVAGTVGAVLAGTGVVALGVGERVVERPVTERVELDPTVSALGGPDDGTLDTVRQSVAPAVVGIEAVDAPAAGEIAGSGLVVRDDGIIVTSISLVAVGATTRVRLPDGTVASAELVGTDPTTGLAVLDMDGDHAPGVLAASSDLVAGGTSFVVGAAPRGSTTAAGVVGQAQRFLGAEGGSLDGIEVEGDADPAALGGPTVDAQGTVVGIATAVDDGSAWYVVPVEVTRRVTDGLLSEGVVRHSRMGIEGTDAAAEPAADEGVAGETAGGGESAPADGDAPGTLSTTSPGGGGGTLVASVTEGSPADAAGLAAGDVVVALDGQAIARLPDLTLALRSRAPGDQVEVTVIRADGTRASVELTLDEAPRVTP